MVRPVCVSGTARLNNAITRSESLSLRSRSKFPGRERPHERTLMYGAPYIQYTTAAEILLICSTFILLLGLLATAMAPAIPAPFLVRPARLPILLVEVYLTIANVTLAMLGLPLRTAFVGVAPHDYECTEEDDAKYEGYEDLDWRSAVR